MQRWKKREERCIKDPKFYFEHVNFTFPICCQLEMSGRLLDAGTGCCSVVVKTQSLGSNVIWVQMTNPVVRVNLTILVFSYEKWDDNTYTLWK